MKRVGNLLLFSCLFWSLCAKGNFIGLDSLIDSYTNEYLKKDSNVQVESETKHQRKFAISFYAALSNPIGSYQEDIGVGDRKFYRELAYASGGAKSGNYYQLEISHLLSTNFQLGIAYGYLINASEIAASRLSVGHYPSGGGGSYHSVPTESSDWEHHLVLAIGRYSLINKRFKMDFTIGLGGILSKEPLFKIYPNERSVVYVSYASIPDEAWGFVHQYGFKWSYLLFERVLPFVMMQGQFAEQNFSQESYVYNGVEEEFRDSRNYVQKIYTINLGAGVRVLF